jgi:hypothetical protein
MTDSLVSRLPLGWREEQLPDGSRLLRPDPFRRWEGTALLCLGVIGFAAIDPSWPWLRTAGLGVVVLCIGLVSAFMVLTGLRRLLVHETWRVSLNSLARTRRFLGLRREQRYLGAELEVGRNLATLTATSGPREWSIRVRRKGREAVIFSSPFPEDARAFAAYLQQHTGWPLTKRDA